MRSRLECQKELCLPGGLQGSRRCVILVGLGQTRALFYLGIPAQCSAREEALLAPGAVLAG